MSESNSGQKFRVITVHGVNSKGEWQEEVAKALGLFFNFEPIKYNHYRWFFGTELVLCPFVWLPLGTIFTVAILMGWVHGGCGICLCILVIVLLSGLGAYPYRRWAVKKFREKLSQKFQKGGPFPCLIAHSFGTYLSGRAMRDLPWPSYDRMVLAGCVLEGDFPWEELQGSNPPRFHEVRNEMAARDNIARLAAWLDRLIPGFGSAGYSGFQGSAQWVHNVGSANIVCSTCDSSKSRAPIHNRSKGGNESQLPNVADNFLGTDSQKESGPGNPRRSPGRSQSPKERRIGQDCNRNVAFRVAGSSRLR